MQKKPSEVEKNDKLNWNFLKTATILRKIIKILINHDKEKMASINKK